jgi:hypothetical protein
MPDARGRRGNGEPIDERHARDGLGVAVPNFGGVAPFLRGTDMLASLPSLLRLGPSADSGSLPCR